MFSRIYQANEKHWRGQQQKESEIAIRNYNLPFVAQAVKNLPAMQETWVRSRVGKIAWRRAWQPTPVFLPGESPWTEEPGGLQSTGLQRLGHSWATKCSTAHSQSHLLALCSPQIPHPRVWTAPAGIWRDGGASTPRYMHSPFALNPCCLPQNGVVGDISATLLTKVRVTTADALTCKHMLPSQVLVVRSC